MPKLKIFPLDQIIEVNSQKSVLAQLRESKIYLDSSCGGFATCGECVVKIRQGDAHCSSPTFEEIRLLGNIFHLTHERLSCQLKLQGDVEIDISKHASLNSPKEKSNQKVQSVVRRKKSPNVETESEAISSSKTDSKTDQNSGQQGGFKRPKRRF